MIKRIIIFTLVVLTLSALGFFLNDFFVEKNDISLTFSLLSIYIFNAIASLVIYISVEVVVNYLPNETGYLYLGLMLVKFGVFILLYQDSIFSETGLTKPEKISILVPILTFLFVEAAGVSKLLNNR
ncbi:DUF6168 family protein [Tenacibaculum sp. 1B UA]|uniref:DUF6168 family protein n=1 Tax=unclassified Tenacibaculum TaxID=2635139 RepID=UPI0026E46AA1|nr:MULTISPECIES: DUF6168 family protein [unclassified Tenacibaculum]MDO6674468.1 DUF6168 family protein [Tenacibaculum sp. 1_MG-2023]MDX8552223.1 DUF6168 family protein [Tenacibaculum sp. 1B UA]